MKGIRTRLLSLLLVLLALINFGCSPGATQDHLKTSEWIKAFESSFVQANDAAESEQLSVLRWIYESPWLTFDVGLEAEKIPKDCRFRNFQATYSAHDHSSSAAGSEGLSDLTADYIAKCEKAISTGPKDIFRNLYRTLFIRFAAENNPYFRRIVLNLPNGYKQPGLLALKDDKYNRPWLILRAGILGNSVDIQAERFILLQLFEQGPFNVLFLDSMTSAETIKKNEQLSVGGLDEGLQNYQIARQLKNPAEPLSRLVGDIHLMALSMGGHGLLMAMILNETNPEVFKSAVGLCPMVQFRPTFVGHEQSPWSFFLMNLYSSTRMSPLLKREPSIRRTQFLPDAFAYVEANYKGPLTDDGTVKFPAGFPKEDFRRGNELLPYVSLIKHPISVFATLQDDLVPYAINTQVLRDLPGKSVQVRTYPLQESYHCSFPGAYSWSEMSELLKAQFFGAKSNYQVPGFRTLYWPLPQKKNADQLGQQLPEALKFALNDQDEFLTVKIRIGDQNEFTTQIPIGALSWGTIGRVRNETEARTLKRFALSNIQLVANTDGELNLAWLVPGEFTFTGDGIVIR